ncbi:MAG: lysine 2,3-aminomutase [Gammaproteobacteria bacterium]|nr:lysine 2,3-aminomutase [Gammaproteobacteria bacterium]MDH5802196.1 lysine 2,3-aminomutase [Gammaproteobacteria bacterium]
MSKILQFYRKREQYQDLFNETQSFKVFTERQLGQISQLQRLSEKQRFDMKVVANVLPFRVNQYVIDELINWANIPHDPLFQLTFPQPGMLEPHDFDRMAQALRANAGKEKINGLAKDIRAKLNPHPGGQQNLNVPIINNQPIAGMQHKYRETVLFFPSQGQTCHSYCSFCFRWAQFVGDKELRFASNETSRLHQYLRVNKEVSDLLITGGDPMVMKTSHLQDYLLPLLEKDFEHIQNIRIGTKAISFWPHRFVSDNDADELLDVFRRLVAAGKHVAIMTHFNHWREMETPMAIEAIRRLRATGAVLRSQSPLIKHINDDAEVWAKMWQMQTRLGIIPYYMFVERDTGAKEYFQVPLHRAWNIYREALKKVSGLSRTVRGPSMSATPGKVEIQGVTELQGEKVFACRMIQGRDPDWVQKPFFAQYDESATWLDDLKPAFGADKFFFDS